MTLSRCAPRLARTLVGERFVGWPAPRSPPGFLGRRASASASSAHSSLRLSFVLPHETIYHSSPVAQVNLAADSGHMGVLANHVPSLESLAPGVLEVFESQGSDSQKWFVSAGFANVHPNNLLTVNAVEAFPLDAFSLDSAKAGLQEAQRALATGTDAQKAEAAVEVQVFEALIAALK